MQDQGETFLGKKLHVLDHGFVRLVDYMGSDSTVAHYASLGRAHTTTLSEEESIKECFRLNQLFPFEQSCLVFQIRLPIYVMGQLVRHRTAKLNSFSARYAKVEDYFHEPKAEELRMQSSSNKQVGTDLLNTEIAETCSQSIHKLSRWGYQEYLSLLDRGVCREQARTILPQNMYTTIFWKIDLRNLFHFLRLRLHTDAQKEIRLYAEKIGFVLSQLFPLCWKHFHEVYLSRISLSCSELALLKRLNVSF
ncbi:FAD-dependent thymidylate synthase [Candidatus Similichlamydia laticola]|uniref:FAD-dependent thymidylate synthase n=1 Tax=Candidatus Similichlamydia laticola TaxID=2170265 RepID=A0A369KD91_9BACT|nr:FAD-dependent thymidylate synthase [Candidatus Similichlamydia laticola]RDB31572.1 Thymidylate synthase thyX [Candidatus Similichlamydia laticola]